VRITWGARHASALSECHPCGGMPEKQTQARMESVALPPPPPAPYVHIPFNVCATLSTKRRRCTCGASRRSRHGRAVKNEVG